MLNACRQPRAVTLGLLLLLATCVPVEPQGSTSGTADPTEIPTQEINPLAGTQWRLSSFGKPNDLLPASVESPPTLSFKETDLSGTTGCNQYGADYSLSSDKISFERLFHTEMECLEPGLRQQETDYVDLLHLVESFTLDGEILTLSGPQGMLVYESVVSPAEIVLVRRLWRLESIVQVDGQAVVNTPVDARVLITAWFDDRRIGGRTGCNSYGASYQKMGERLSLLDNELEMTEAACPDDELANLERVFLEALRVAETFAIDGDRLTINFADGQLIFAAQPETASDENAVYAAVLREWDGSARSYVFREKTQFNEPGVTLKDTLLFIQQQLPPPMEGDPWAISPEVLEDFERKNTSSNSLREILHYPFLTAFIAEEEWSTMFSAGDNAGWEAFHEQFPESQGVFTFSRVGFNEAGDQALVYMAMLTEDFEGGYYFLLRQQEGLWSSTISFMIWGWK